MYSNTKRKYLKYKTKVFQLETECIVCQWDCIGQQSDGLKSRGK